MAKTDWQYDDVVTETDMNEIGEEINETRETVDTHIDAVIAHDATAAATAGRMVVRDDNGRAKFAEPEDDDDAAVKKTVDDAITIAADDATSKASAAVTVAATDATSKAAAAETNAKAASLSLAAGGTVAGPIIGNGTTNKFRGLSAASSYFYVESYDVTSYGAGRVQLHYRPNSQDLYLEGRDDDGNAVNIELILNGKHVETTNGSQARANAVQDNLNDHEATITGVHGGTSTPTPNRIVTRDSSGRAKFAAPSASDDVARKADVDAAEEAAKASSLSLSNGGFVAGPITGNGTENNFKGLGVISGYFEINSYSTATYGTGKMRSYHDANNNRWVLVAQNSVGTAVPLKIDLNGVYITSGNSSPEGSLTAPVGSIYLSLTNGLYVKESGIGNTGWVAK